MLGEDAAPHWLREAKVRRARIAAYIERRCRILET